MAGYFSIRFYSYLNEFLPHQLRQRSIQLSLRHKDNVKDKIEALGIPHTEVDLILANNKSIGFHYQIQNEDHIAVFPGFLKFTIHQLSKVHGKYPDEFRFILDVHLGKLARFLRLAGFDSLYSNDFEDEYIINKAEKEKRIVLTRDKGILFNGKVKLGAYVRTVQPNLQFEEVLERFQLRDKMAPFTRCMECNGKIQEVKKSLVQDQIPKDTKKYFNRFFQCNNCKKIYWEGNHYQEMRKYIKNKANNL